MPDLADFLLARIGEDEADAQEAVSDARPDWIVGCEETSDGDNAFWAVEALGESSEWFADLGSQPSDHARAAHIARWDPARVLAECAAKRQIIRLMLDGYSQNDVEYWALDDALRLLALPYADHDGYDPEWRP